MVKKTDLPDFMTNPNNPGHPGPDYDGKKDPFLWAVLILFAILIIFAIILSACTPIAQTCIPDKQCATKDNLTVCLDSNDTIVLERIMSIFEEEK